MTCPCCGGDADRCVLSPTGCALRGDDDLFAEADREYALWQAACLLREHRPFLLSATGRAYATDSAPDDGMPF